MVRSRRGTVKKLLVALICGTCALAVLSAPVVVSASGHAHVAKKKKCKKSKKAAAAKKKKKCKPKLVPTPPSTTPPTTTTPPTGTTPTPPPDADGDGVPDSSDNCVNAANADQADSDTDGKGDACDFCPVTSNPGIIGCPTTIYDINQGNVPSGTNIRITSALVTAKMSDGSAFWVEVDPGGPGFSGFDFFGLEVASGSVTAPSPGSPVTIDGIVGTQSLTATQVQVVAPTEPPAPASVAPASFADPSSAAKLNGAFVTISSAVTLSSQAGGDWMTSAGFTVGHRIIALPACQNGANITFLHGIADIEGGNLVLLPRDPSDIDQADC
jgi:large repetitive protein